MAREQGRPAAMTAAPPVPTGETGWDRTAELVYSIGRLDDATELLLSHDTTPSKQQRDLAAAACRDVIAALARIDKLDQGAAL